MKKKIIKLVKVVLIVSLLINVKLGLKVQADVGGIQRYDSSSSSSSYSSSSSGSYSSSDYDWGTHSSSGSYSSSGSFTLPEMIIFLVVVGIVIYVTMKQNGDTKSSINSTKDNTKQVATQIRQIDPMFSEDNFLAWTKEVFIKLQTAWTKKDWSIIRPFESNELFEQHNSQLQEFIERGRTNIVERINVTSATLYSFKQDGDKETLKVTLKAVMRDYIIDDSTKRVLEGNPNVDQYMTYRLTFIRKAGVKTKPGTNSKSTTNCPNCGAPTQITSAGKCEYCGSVITTGEHDWILSNLEGV